MTVRFKFAKPAKPAKPANCSVVEIDPNKGFIVTTNAAATIRYKIDMGAGTCPDVMLNIDCRAFEAKDIDELISFLEIVRDRMRKIS